MMDKPSSPYKVYETINFADSVNRRGFWSRSFFRKYSRFTGMKM